MTKRNSRRKRCRVQSLTLPELDQSKTAVLKQSQFSAVAPLLPIRNGGAPRSCRQSWCEPRANPRR